MSNFDNADAENDSVRNANNLLSLFRAVYTNGTQIQALLALYQAGTDPTFNGTVNSMFNAAERSELGVMQAQINSLVSDWAANHRAAIGLPPL